MKKNIGRIPNATAIFSPPRSKEADPLLALKITVFSPSNPRSSLEGSRRKRWLRKHSSSLWTLSKTLTSPEAARVQTANQSDSANWTKLRSSDQRSGPCPAAWNKYTRWPSKWRRRWTRRPRRRKTRRRTRRLGRMWSSCQAGLTWRKFCTWTTTVILIDYSSTKRFIHSPIHPQLIYKLQ